MTMSEALVEIQKGVRTFQAFALLEDKLTYLSGLEQNERELTDRIDALKADLVNAGSQLAEVTASHREFDALLPERERELGALEDRIAAAKAAITDLLTS